MPTTIDAGASRRPVVRGPLENYANNVSPPPARGRRYARRTVLWDLSSLERVRKCGRVQRGDLVGVRTGANGAGFSGLCTCGSIWACPVCNAKVMARRAVELGCAVATWQARGGAMVFGTYTLRHHRGHRLADLWDALSLAWRSVISGAPWIRRSKLLGLHGVVRAVEVTHGENGWHVHLHVLFLVDGSVTQDAVDDFGAWSAARWSRAVVRRGLPEPLAVGQHVRLVRDVADGDLAAYVTKQTDLSLELTQSQSKRARSAHATAPVWELLTQLQSTGDLEALDVWHEWEAGSFNRRHLTWSVGLRRDLLGNVPELSDEDIASEEAGDEDLVYITSEGWASLVARPHLIPRVLDAAELSPLALRDFLHQHRVEHLTPKDVTL